MTVHVYIYIYIYINRSADRLEVINFQFAKDKNCDLARSTKVYEKSQAIVSLPLICQSKPRQRNFQPRVVKSSSSSDGAHGRIDISLEASQERNRNNDTSQLVKAQMRR
jgi:hypothetical protein